MKKSTAIIIILSCILVVILFRNTFNWKLYAGLTFVGLAIFFTVKYLIRFYKWASARSN